MSFNFTLKTEKIEFAGGDITVRGLAVPDLVQLVQVNRDNAVEIYDKFAGRDANGFSGADAATIAMDIATKFPTLVAHTICLAADAPDKFEEAAHLPLDVQVVALEKIANLTFQMSGGLKNFAETVLRIAGNVNGLAKSGQVSMNGSAA